MFQDNPLLAQLKQQLHSQTPRAEGVVKPQKRLWLPEVDAQKLFHSAAADEKVMHGDRIIAVIHSEKNVNPQSQKNWLNRS